MIKHFLVGCLLVFTNIIGSAQETRNYLSHDEQFNKALQLFQAKNYPSAYTLFKQLSNDRNNLDALPTEQQMNAELYMALSATYSGKQSGIVRVNQFLDNYPNHPNSSAARLELANYYFNNRDFNSALAQLQRINVNALSNEQQSIYNMSMGYALFVKKQFKQAKPYLQTVAAGASPNKQEATYYLGVSHYFLKEYDKAWNYLSSLNQSRFANEIPYYRARILFEQQQYNEVVNYVEPLLNKQLKNSVEINQIIGQSYFNLEQYPKALPYLEAYSNQAKSQSPEAQYQLAYTQYQLGQYNKAVSNFEKLNIIEDEIGQYALYAMAESYIKLNEKNKAKNAFSRAATMNFNAKIQENSAFNEAKLSYELGKNAEAINLVQSFITEYPSSNYKKEANTILVDLFLTSNNYKDALAILSADSNRSNEMDNAYQKVAYFRAVELYNNGNLAAAKPLLDEVIAHPYDARYVALANYWLGEMAYEYGRYDKAIDYITTFQNATVSIPAEYTSQANYTLGYAQYKKKNYERAANSLSKVMQNQPYSYDASLRAADSYFALGNYNSATIHYNKVANANTSESDYAAYQIAILKGLRGETVNKLNQLKSLYTGKPNSAYADNALFEYGRVFVTQEKYSTAEQSFNQLLQQYPNSEQVVPTYSQLGLIHYNQSNYDKAIEYYKKIISIDSNSEESKSALNTIEDIYIEKGEPNEYFAYLKSVNGISLNSSEQEEIVFKAAETQFQNGDCTKATQGFSNYLNQYPTGIYSVNAMFYRGECALQTNQVDTAIQDFKAVVKRPHSKFTERSLIRVARYEYRMANYHEAINLYKQVDEANANTESIYKDEVAIGLMQSYNHLGQRDAAANYADRVLAISPLEQSIAVEAKFLNAIQHYQVGSLDVAKSSFTEIAASSRNQFGAEARYMLAKILHDEMRYTESIEASYRVADETPSEDDWVAKSFILIADNYVQLNELFQAKATLDSVIKNYTGNSVSIIEEAKRKRAEIDAKERQNSNILNSDTAPSNQLQLQDN